MNVQAPKGKVIIKVDIEFKNNHTFNNGTEIRIERNYNQFNEREKAPVQGIVISSEYIPEGAIVLIHHNGTHDTNRLFDFQKLSGKEIASDIKYYSIAEEHVYLWKLKEEHEWNPVKNYATALRVYKPYNGILQGIDPRLIPQTLYIKSGKLKGKAVRTLKHSDYEIIFRSPETGKEERIIRLRHSDSEEYYEREEITCIDEWATEKINNGDFLVGLTPTTAKKIGLTPLERFKNVKINTSHANY